MTRYTFHMLVSTGFDYEVACDATSEHAARDYFVRFILDRGYSVTSLTLLSRVPHAVAAPALVAA